MLNLQETEQRIGMKISGENVQSFIDLAFKMDSSIGFDDKSDHKQQDIKESEPFEKSRVYNISKDLQISAGISYITRDVEVLKDQTVDSSYDYNAKKYEYPSKDADLIQSDDNFKMKEDYSISQMNLKTKSIQIPMQRTNRQITFMKPHPNFNMKSQRLLNNESQTKRNVKLSGFNTTEKLVKLFTVVKPKLIKFIENYTMFGRYRHLKQSSRQILADKTDYTDYDRDQKKKNIFIKFINTQLKIAEFFEELFFMMLEKIPLFNPENKPRIMINAMIVCYNCFYLLVISFNIFFQANFGSVQHTIHEIATAAWVIEMFIQMNTATYYEGDFITNRKVIFKIYLKEYFFFEILPLIFEGRTSTNTVINIFLHLPLLLKLKGMSNILQKLEFLILQHLKRHYILQISKLLLQLLLLIHLMACSYITLAKFEQNVLNLPYTWLEKSEIYFQQYNWWNAYIEAQLWAFYTMGNSYSPSVFTGYEYAFTSFWMLISCILFAYLINTLGNILQDINSISENYKKDVNVLNRYMKRKKIDIELQRVMNTHLVKQYEQESQVQFDAEKEALKKLSYHMKNKLVTESNKNILSQFSFFNIFSLQTKQSIYQIMEEVSYSEGQMIQTFEESTLDNFIYLILQGSVEIIQLIKLNDQSKEDRSQFIGEESKYNDEEIIESQKIVQILSVGKKFGEVEFFQNTQLPYIIRSMKQAVVIRISRIQLISIISQNKSDYQKFMEIKQRIQFYNQINVIDSSCYICKSQNHHFLNCNQAHLPKISSFLISRQNYSSLQTRNSSYERLRKKYSKCIVKLISNHVISLQDSHDNGQVSLLSSNEVGEESSILKKNIQQQPNSNNAIIVQKNKNSENVLDERYSNDQTSQNQEAVSIVQKNPEEGKKNPLNNGQLPNFRLSYIKRISTINKQTTEGIDILLPHEKIDIIDERISLQDLNTLIIHDPATSSQVLLNSLQPNKNQNNVTSMRVIKKQNQNATPILSQQLNQGESDQNVFSSLYEINQYQNEPTPSKNRNSTQFYQPPKVQHQNSNQKNLIEPIQHQAYNTQVEHVIFKQQWDRSFFYWTFEKKEEFINFFPHHNCKNVLRKMETRLKFLKEKKKILQTRNEHNNY